MKYRIEISPEAKEDIQKAKLWYEEQQVGLGKRVTEIIKQHINSLKPELVEHKIVFDDFRRVLVKMFPYTIYYKRYKKDKVIKVLAVLHDRQNKYSRLQQ